MPSGAKKRKAAKKKKEQVISSTNNHPHGNDDSKSRDDVGSPASQVDHNHQHSFNHREEERKPAPAHVEPHVTEEKSGLDDVGTAHARIQHVEHDKSSSCSISSDDESRAYEKKSKEEVYNLGSEETSNGNEVKLATLKSVSDGVESRSNESETELLLPSNGTPPTETSNVEENTRVSDPRDSRVAATTPMVQRTSLLSCCGLFDVLTGSNR
ncbi:hypothetical protein HRI_003021600 [Hibiscus trionum]|uniref:Uncharacterized protein n=1 Tax=Hibiscus trionum TaxID=183268 RepID=A0A9W7IDP2_HIBTR|nr:hypothetical protein HRI_003021600 [Hibiscus trionum]